MNAKRIGLLALIYYSMICRSGAADDRDIGEIVQGEDDIRSKLFTAEIHDSTVAKTPAWDPHGSLPPISMADAVKRCEAYLPTLVPNAKEWQLGSIEVTLPYPLEANKWVYEIEFYPPDSEIDRGAIGRIFLAVLMDGTLVKPRVSKLAPRIWEWQVYKPSKK